MKKFLVIALVAFAALGLFVSCSSSSDDDGAGGINGKWTLSKIDGQAASSAGISMTLTVKDSATYTLTGTWLTLPINDSGTVVAKSDKVYSFTNSDDEVTEYTLDGDTLTGTDPDDGKAYVFVK